MGGLVSQFACLPTTVYGPDIRACIESCTDARRTSVFNLRRLSRPIFLGRIRDHTAFYLLRTCLLSEVSLISYAPVYMNGRDVVMLRIDAFSVSTLRRPVHSVAAHFMSNALASFMSISLRTTLHSIALLTTLRRISWRSAWRMCVARTLPMMIVGQLSRMFWVGSKPDLWMR